MSAVFSFRAISKEGSLLAIYLPEPQHPPEALAKPIQELLDCETPPDKIVLTAVCDADMLRATADHLKSAGVVRCTTRYTDPPAISTFCIPASPASSITEAEANVLNEGLLAIMRV